MTTTATSSAAGPAGDDPRPVRRVRRSEPARRRWPGRALTALAVVLCGIVVVGSLSGSWKVLRVPTGSMEPTIGRGSAILVESVPTGDVGVGDVVVFHAPTTGELTVHRIVEAHRGDDGLVIRTRGDANDADDPWQARIEGSRVHRHVRVVPLLGAVTARFADGRVRLAVAAASAVLVLVGGLRLIWGPGRNADRIASGNARETARRRRDRRRRRSAAAALLAVVGLGTSAAAALSADPVEAAFSGASGTLGDVGSGFLLTPSDPTCRWTSSTQLRVDWTMGPGGIQTGAEVVRTTLAGGSPTTVAAVAPPTVGTATVTAPAPVTTPHRYAARTTRAPWTSALTTSLRSDECGSAVAVFAGNGTAGFLGDGGAATAARLNAPRGVATLPDGTAYVADTANHRIRRIAPDGTITTFAGGPAASACTYSGPVSGLGLNAPRGVAVDTTGNVYVADTGANCVRMIDGAGNVSRVAGGGATTTCNATLTPATVSLLTPSDVALDGSGNVIVADTGRNCIRRVSATQVTHVAGGGATTTCTTASVAAAALSLSGPTGVAVDTSGAVVVTDNGRNCVRRVAAGTATHVMGGGATTSCTAASLAANAVSLSAPEAVEVDPAGRVIVVDTGRRCLRLATGAAVTPLGFTGTSSSTGDGGPVQAATIRVPSGVALRADGDVLVSDRSTSSGSSEVRRIVTPLP